MLLGQEDTADLDRAAGLAIALADLREGLFRLADTDDAALSRLVEQRLLDRLSKLEQLVKGFDIFHALEEHDGMPIHLDQQIAARARDKLFEHVERSLVLGLQDLERKHAALTVHLDLMLMRQRFQLGTRKLFAKHTAIDVVAALNRRFTAAHGLNHRARKHDAVMRRRALRIRAEDQLRRDADHQEGLSLKGDRHARLHELRQVDLAAVFFRQKNSTLGVQQPERLHQTRKNLLNLI